MTDFTAGVGVIIRHGHLGYVEVLLPNTPDPVQVKVGEAVLVRMGIDITSELLTITPKRSTESE